MQIFHFKRGLSPLSPLGYVLWVRWVRVLRVLDASDTRPTENTRERPRYTTPPRLVSTDMFALSESHLLQHLAGQPAAQADPQKRAAEARILDVEMEDDWKMRQRLRARTLARQRSRRKSGYLEQGNELAAEVIARLNPSSVPDKSSQATAGEDDFDDFDFDDLDFE